MLWGEQMELYLDVERCVAFAQTPDVSVLCLHITVSCIRTLGPHLSLSSKERQGVEGASSCLVW